MKPRVSVNWRQWLLGVEYSMDSWLYLYLGPVALEWWVGR